MADPLEPYLGVKLGSLIAGFLGGLVKALIMPSVTPSGALFSCVIGALTAGYFTPVVIYWLPFAGIAGAEGAVGYAIGLTAMLICEGLIRAATRWRDDPRLPPKP